MSIKSWIVVGRGIIGLVAAYRLAKAGYQVTIIGPDTRNSIGSIAALGNFTAKGLVVSDNNILAARIAGQAYMLELAQELSDDTGASIPRLAGIYEPFESLEALKLLRKRIYHNNFSALNSFMILNAQELAERAAFFAARAEVLNFSGCLYYPNDFWLDPPSLLDCLEAAIRKRGGTILNDKVMAIEALAAGGMKAHLAGAQLVADDFLLAAGVATNQILEGSKLVPLPVAELPGVTIEASSTSAASVAITEARQGLVLWNGRLRFGSFDGNSGGQSEISKTPPFSHRSLAAVLKEESISQHTEIRGVRSYTRDRLPLFGPIWPFSSFPATRLWIGSAFYKVGYYLADYCARNLVNTLQNRPTDPFFSSMSPQRIDASSKCIIRRQ